MQCYNNSNNRAINDTNILQLQKTNTKIIFFVVKFSTSSTMKLNLFSQAQKSAIALLLLLITFCFLCILAFLVYVRLTVNDSSFPRNVLRENTVSQGGVNLDNDSDLAPEIAKPLNRFEFAQKLSKPNELGIFFIFKKKSVACASSSRLFNKAYNVAVLDRRINQYNRVLPLYRVRVIDIESTTIENDVKARGVPYILFKIRNGVNRRIVGKRTVQQYYDLIVDAFSE